MSKHDHEQQALHLLNYVGGITDFAYSEACHSAIWNVANGEVTNLAGFLDAIKAHAEYLVRHETLSKVETTKLVRAANEHWHTWARSLIERRPIPSS
jgi:hypothetical protein